MSGLTIVVSSFIIMGSVFIAPQLSELQGKLATITCLLFALLFWVVQIIIER